MVPVGNGEITIDGRPLANMSRKDIARRIAYLSQGKDTPDMTVEQLVLHGRFPHLSYSRRYTKKDREIAFAAMERVGITDHVHQPLSALSGGMRQNAYIAMALTQGTDYVLLDEPNTYLDISHQLELMKILRALADDNKGVVAVMHDLPMAFSFSDKIILIDEGRVVCDAAPGGVYEQNAVECIFGIAFERSADGSFYHYRY